jgi:hypothetical protein
MRAAAPPPPAPPSRLAPHVQAGLAVAALADVAPAAAPTHAGEHGGGEEAGVAAVSPGHRWAGAGGRWQRLRMSGPFAH